MNIDWKKTMACLNERPEIHRFLPPCPEELLEAVQKELGKMPTDLIAMLRVFNGAQLYDKIGPLIRIFGITPATPLPPFEWAPDWTIDKYTPV